MPFPKNILVLFSHWTLRLRPDSHAERFRPVPPRAGRDAVKRLTVRASLSVTLASDTIFIIENGTRNNFICLHPTDIQLFHTQPASSQPNVAHHPIARSVSSLARSIIYLLDKEAGLLSDAGFIENSESAPFIFPDHFNSNIFFVSRNRLFGSLSATASNR